MSTTDNLSTVTNSTRVYNRDQKDALLYFDTKNLQTNPIYVNFQNIYVTIITLYFKQRIHVRGS